MPLLSVVRGASDPQNLQIRRILAPTVPHWYIFYHLVLKSLNFHEFLRDNPDSYPVILFAVMGFNILHLLTAIISMKRLQQK
jgi:hypothetical protein